MSKQRPSPDERLEQMTKLFNFFDGHRSANYDQNAETYWRLYTGYVEPLDEDDDRSNLHIMLPYEAVDTWRARLLTTFWGNQRPFVTCHPLPTGDMTPEKLYESIAKGKLAGSLLDTQFERNNIVPLMYKYNTSLLTFPFVALGVDWYYEKKMVKTRKLNAYPADLMGYVDKMVLEIAEEEKVTYDDNRLRLIDYEDFWPDPYGEDIDTFRGVFVREYVTRKELESLMDTLSDLTKELQDGEVYQPDYELEQNIYRFGTTFSKASFAGEEINIESGFEHGSEHSLFELLHFWTDEDHIIIFNRQQIIFDGPNPFWRHGKKPFVYTSFEPLPGKAVGLSAVQLIEHLSAEIDTQRNQRIDYASMVLNPMFEVAGDLDESELIWRRNGIIHVNQLQKQVGKLDLGNIPQSAFAETGETKNEAYSTLAVPDVVRGVDTQRQQTATYTATQNTNASIRFDVKLKLWEWLGMKRMAMLMDCNNQQFIDTARLVRLNWKEETIDSWQFVEPWEIQGEWDYRPSGTATDPASNRELKTNRLAEILLKSQNDPDIKRRALWRKFLEMSDVTSTPDEFVKTDDEAAREIQMQQQAQMEQQQMQIQQEQSKQQFQADQNMVKIIADVVKQVLASQAKGGDNQGGRSYNGKAKKSKKAK